MDKQSTVNVTQSRIVADGSAHDLPVTASADNMMAGSVGVRVNGDVTITLHVESPAVNAADFTSSAMLWMDSVLIVLTVFSVTLAIAATTFAFLGVKKYNEIEEWRLKMQSDIDKKVDDALKTPGFLEAVSAENPQRNKGERLKSPGFWEATNTEKEQRNDQHD